MKKLIYILVFFFFLISFSIIMSYLFIFPIYMKTNEINIPNIINLDLDEAVNILEQNKLSYEVNYIDSDINDDNKIIKTLPKCNNKIKIKSKVSLYVGKANNTTFKLNDYINKNYDDIKEEIKKLEINNKLNIVLVYEKNDDYPNNTIIKQIPKENTLINNNTVLVLYLSSYEGKITLPNFKGWNIDSVKEYQKNNKLNIEYIYSYSDIIEKDIVIEQSIFSNTIWYKGKNDVIKIYISKGKKEEIPDFEGLDLNVAVIILDFLKIDYEVNFIQSNLEKNIIIEQVIKTDLNDLLILTVSK